ncbi:MAG: amidohydrolase family protein [Verrucomicrobia subdivision 3 bacterium]|nr:amidohydrolase family protein [Limisphaerales bacterium]
MKTIDMHVHMVGNEASGNGCWIRVTPGKYPLYALMLHKLGVPVRALRAADFDDLYRDRLLHYIRDSAVDAVCLLAQEAVYDTKGSLLKNHGSAFVPNDVVLRLAKEHPEFLPAVSIHPARPDAMDELNRCLDAGAVMMKCLPNCQNIDCNNPRFKPFWDRMAEAGLPFLAHTGGEHTLEVINAEYANPKTLRLPLECGVNVIAAHAATGSGPFDPNYLPTLVQMMRDHKNLYADSSALNVPTRSHGLRPCLENELLASRTVHGSDYPVPTSPSWAWLRGLIDSDQLATLRNIQNPIEQDYQTKVAMGFPAEHFTRINPLLRTTG